jgi:fluoride ion exporter CrcB/FEX
LEKYLYIAIGGSLGSIARYWVGSTISGRLGTKFPYGKNKVRGIGPFCQERNEFLTVRGHLIYVTL